MFKKMFKDLTENLIDKAQKAAADQGGSPYNEALKAYMDGDMQKVMDVGAASKGIKTMNTATEDPNDPLLQPVHGISIADYAAGMARMGAGCTDAEIAEALGVETPQWAEAKTTWNNRMRSDGTYNVVNVYSKYYGDAQSHPKLANLEPKNKPATTVSSEAAKATLEKLASDKYYFYEIQGALQAAYDNGIDGAQWLVDELGVTISQVNEAGFKWMSDFSIMAAMDDYQEQKKKEYSAKFASEHGTGSIVDDIEF